MISRTINALKGIEATDAPFFLLVPLLGEPHPPYFASPPYDTMVDPVILDVPDQGNDGRPEWQAMAREQMGTDKASDADVRQMIAVYYGMIEYADAQLRRLVDEMRQRGLMDNTWVVISADHGDYSGEKSLFTKTESLYECLLHVPLIIVPPEGTPWDRSSKVSGLVDHIDLFPTILGIARR